MRGAGDHPPRCLFGKALKMPSQSRVSLRARFSKRRSQLGSASAAFEVLENVSFHTAVVSVSGVTHAGRAEKGMLMVAVLHHCNRNEPAVDKRPADFEVSGSRPGSAPVTQHPLQVGL